MRYFILLALLFTPVSAADDNNMSCVAVKEIVEVVMEDPYLSDKDKTNILKNLISGHGMSCLRDAND